MATESEVSELMGQLSLGGKKKKGKKASPAIPSISVDAATVEETGEGSWRPNVPTLETPKDEILTPVEADAAAQSASKGEQSTIIYKKYGMFKCPKCAHKWTSAHAWREKGQMCLNCSDETREVYVLPYQVKEREVVPGGRFFVKMKHQRELCQMCQQLNRNCTKVNAVKKAKKNKKRS